MSLAVEPQLVSALPLDPYDRTDDSQNPPTESQQEEDKKWDVFELSSDEWQESYRAGEFKKLVKLLKIVVYVLTFLILLGSAIVSKASLLLMTSGIKKKNAFSICGNYNKYIDRDKNIIEFNDRRPFIWCLLCALFVPEILTFLRSVRVCIFKQYNVPNLSTFLLVLVAEFFHVVGIYILLFVIFPEIHFLKALPLTNAVFIVPSFFNLISNWKSADCSRKSATISTLDLITFMCQLTVVIVIPYYRNWTISGLVVISCLFISCAWWENFININNTILERLRILKDDVEECRQFIYIFIPIWKICLLLALCVTHLCIEEDNIREFFVDFKDSFANLTILISLPSKYDLDVPGNDTVTIKLDPSREDIFVPIITACINIVSSYLCYVCGKFVCKICIQGFSYALPIILSVPATMGLLYKTCEERMETNCNEFFKPFLPYLLWNCPEDNVLNIFIKEGGFMWILWIVSQIWLSHHIWTSNAKRMASTNELFVNPMYCTALIDQCLAMNRRINRKIDRLLESAPEEACDIIDEKNIPRILACATMWHETPDEMELLLKSIMRMDNDQCLKRTFRNQLGGAVNHDYYEVETHVFFDDAFVISDEDDSKMVINRFVKDLIEAVDVAASKIYPPEIKLDPPAKVPTPYGGQLIWKLQGDNMLVVHLKNKDLIRHKKRWSQVMYMYYLLGYRLLNSNILGVSSEDLAKNTYILALDGDIDFKPDAVQLLVDLMKRNENLGAACGRIHPVGTGMMVYYQKFEYAIGHWLQKATEHMIGCVLCSPGCFSLFRAEALMEINVMRRYATMSKEAIEYVQFDQGEDRWLCTLLLQSGFRVEYSAASDAYTHCPESFAEFYTQRRRWAPSTMANIMDLLVNYKKTVQRNDNISLPYIGYQLMLMVGTVLGPGTIFLMLVGAMVSAFGISNWQSLIANFIPVAFFILICFVAKNDMQILVAEIFSAAYALLMMAVIVGISLQMVVDGISSPTAIFLLSMTASFIVAALLHPREFTCVFHGLIYFLSVPSMYLLLTLYSITNLHVVSWGTREVATKKTKKQIEQEKLEEAKNQKKNGMFDWFSFLGDKRPDSEEEGGISFGLANLFRCMCCTYPKPDLSQLHLVKIGEQLETINVQMLNLQRQMDATVIRPSGFRRRSLHDLTRESNLGELTERDEDAEENDDEIDGELDEHPYNLISLGNTDEHWLSDPVLQKCQTWRMKEREEKFWKELIDTYLFPLIDNPQEKAKVASQLLELRNKVVFGILMLNSLFILIVFLLQMQKDTLYIEWPFGGKTESIIYVQGPNEVIIQLEFLRLEPINLFLVFFFSIIVVIQFIAMLFHRFQTISHILASTEINFSQDDSKPEIMMAHLADILQQLNLQPDDTIDGNPRARRQSAAARRLSTTVRRQSTVAKLENKRRERRQSRSLSVAYEQTLKGIVENDYKTVNKVQRLSLNPNLLGAVQRFSFSNITPSTSVRSSSEDLRRLDRAFSGSPASTIRQSYINHAFDGSLDGTDSIASLTSKNSRFIRRT